MEQLLQKIESGEDIAPAFELKYDERFRICGGELRQLGSKCFLVGGHDFDGVYSKNDSTFSQEYTETIISFDIQRNDTSFAITNFVEWYDEHEFHRRDLNMSPVILPNRQPGLAAFGGVFKRTKDLPLEHPIYISADTIEVDSSFSQQYNQYTCPVIPLYQSKTGYMHSLFFGWNEPLFL